MAGKNLNNQSNGSRLSRLLIDMGTPALRRAFHVKFPSHSLTADLLANKPQLQKLRYKVITAAQWRLMYPVAGSPDSRNFDITLLTVLLRNICGLTAPAKGWVAGMPGPKDNSIAAKILRLKFYRNQIFAHITKTEIEDPEFEGFWKEISRVLVSLGTSQKEIDELKEAPLSQEEDIYIEQLTNWKKSEDELKEMVGSLRRYVTDMHNNEMSKSNRFLCETDTFLSELQNCSSQGKGVIESFAESFQSGTRGRLFDNVKRWFVSKTPDSKVMVLTGDPGVGKTTFAAKVCQLYHSKHKLAASYFFKFSNTNLRNPHTMLKSLAGQMIRSIPGFEKVLRKQLQGSYSAETISDAFQVLLNAPLHEVKRPRKRMMIVIDALDESETGEKSELLEVIEEEFGNLPKWIKVFITSRPVLPVQEKLSHLNPLQIRVDDKDNEEDLFKYLKEQLSASEDDISIKTLVQKCEGSFLYAFYLQKELRGRGKSTFYLNDEPQGISLFYKKQFRELEKRLSSCGEECNFKNFLSIMAAAKGPLPLKYLPECFDLPADVNFCNKENIYGIISAFFPVHQGCLTIYHKSLVDWLKSDGYKEHCYTTTEKELKEGNEWLWRKCKTLFQETNFPVEMLSTELQYAVDHGYCHLRDFDGVDVSDYEFLVNFDIVFHKLVSSSTDILNELLQQWQSTLINNQAKMDWKLREKFHWHMMVLSLGCTSCSWYCQNVANSSPFGIFTEEERNSAKTALSDPKYVWLENLTNLERTKTPVIAAQSLHSVEVTSIGVSTNNKLVAVAFRDKTISVFGLPSLELLYSFKLSCREDFCHGGLTFLPGNLRIFCGKLDHCHDLKTGISFPYFSNTSVDDVKMASCSFSPNGTRLVSSDSSNVVKLWDVNQQIPLASLYAGAPVNHCRFSKCGLFIVAANQTSDRNSKYPYGYNMNDAFTIWNAISLERVDRRENLIGTCRSNWPIFNVQAAAKFPECQNISSEIILSENGKYFEIFQLPQALLVARFPSFPPQWESPFTLRTLVPIKYKGCNCILESAHSTLKVIDPLSRLTVEAECRFLPFSYTSSNKVSPVVAGEFVLSVCGGALFVFETPSQRPSVPTWPSPRVTCCSFSPDGSLLASCTNDNWLRIWDVKESSITRSIEIQAGDKPGCWWSETSLWILNVTKEGTSLLKCLTSETTRQQPEMSEIPLTLTQTKLLSFTDGVLIFKCLANNTVSASKIIDDEIKPREILTKDKPIECAAVGRAYILTASVFEFIVWKESIDKFHCYSWSPTIKRCIESSSLSSPRNLSNCHQQACSIDSNGRFACFVVIRENVVQDQKYFCCDCVIVDCLSGSKSNMKMKELHSVILPEILKTNASGERLSVQLSASNGFILRRLYNGNVIDVVDPKKGLVVGEWRPLGYQCQSMLPETTTLPFSPQHNILAIPDEYGSMQFIKLGYQENVPRHSVLEPLENITRRRNAEVSSD